MIGSAIAAASSFGGVPPRVLRRHRVSSASRRSRCGVAERAARDCRVDRLRRRRGAVRGRRPFGTREGSSAVPRRRRRSAGRCRCRRPTAHRLAFVGGRRFASCEGTSPDKASASSLRRVLGAATAAATCERRRGLPARAGAWAGAWLAALLAGGIAVAASPPGATACCESGRCSTAAGVAARVPPGHRAWAVRRRLLLRSLAAAHHFGIKFGSLNRDAKRAARLGGWLRSSLACASRPARRRDGRGRKLDREC